MGGSGSTGQGDGPVDGSSRRLPCRRHGGRGLLATGVVGLPSWRRTMPSTGPSGWQRRSPSTPTPCTSSVQSTGPLGHIYPDVQSSALSPSQDSIGIEALAALLSEHPTSFYAIHASNRLRKLAPDVLASIPPTPPIAPSPTWSVRTVFAEHRPLSEALPATRARQRSLGRVQAVGPVGHS